VKNEADSRKGSLVFLEYVADCYGGCSTNWLPVVQKGQQSSSISEAEEFSRLRNRMVREQLQSRGIADARVLAALRKVPRHEFVPGDLIGSAYEDCALPLKLEQTISQPYIVAYMTARSAGTERAEIGTGSDIRRLPQNCA
jgi:hypothetical protein